MFINIWNGIVTIYRMTISKKTSKLMHDMEYQELVSEKQEETAYDSSFEENQIIGNLIIKNVIYESTGKTRPFNDFYSEDHSIRNYHYTIYRLPKVYFVLKDLVAKHYEALVPFQKCLSDNPNLYNYVWLTECFTMPNSNALKLLIRHSSGQLKMVEDYVGVYHMNLDGMEIKRKVDNYGISN